MDPELRAKCMVKFGRPGTGVGWIAGLAKATGYHVNTVNRWANEKINMSKRAVSDVERALLEQDMEDQDDV